MRKSLTRIMMMNYYKSVIHDSSTTFGTTYYLRGFAISVVLIDHYAGYWTDDYHAYANGVIALFFLLSGYGIFHSMEKRFNQVKSGINLKVLLAFYWDRALRIFPLYWLFLGIYMLFFDYVPSIYIIFAIPIENAPSVGWFVTFLVQCYLLAPFIYLFLKKAGIRKYMTIILLSMFLAYLLSIFYLNTNALPNVYTYRFIFLGHLFLFSLGMALPYTINIIKENKHKAINKIIASLSFILFLVMVHYTRGLYGDSTIELSIYLAPLLILSTFAFSLFFISWNPKLPFHKVLILLGLYSYSVYLFHVFFIQTLKRLGIIQYDELQSIIFLLLLLPIFILICIITEKYTNMITGHLQIRGKQRNMG